MVLLPRTNYKKARQVAERLREGFTSLSLVPGGATSQHAINPVIASMGVAVWEEDLEGAGLGALGRPVHVPGQ